MWLTGRPLVAAMCIGQLGNLLPHVTVPAIMVQSLMPLWRLTATEAGIMASALAFGYMLAVPVLATLTDRIDASFMLAAGSALSGLCGVGHWFQYTRVPAALAPLSFLVRASRPC
jgi:sugar phosphate permease